MKEVKEVQQELDFTPTEAELAYVDRMADVVIGDMKAKVSFEGSRNRSAWKRMNRPHSAQMQDKGATKVFALLDRFKCRVTVTGNEDTGENVAPDTKVS
jgi:hypothetical protein